MEKIKFYYKGEFLGEGDLPEMTCTMERHKIARDLNIRRYDRFQFINKDGNVRCDSNEISPKSFFKKEFGLIT